MDMLDPSKAAAEAPGAQNLTDVSGAVSDTESTQTAATADATPALEVENLMAEAELEDRENTEEAEEALTPEALVEAAKALLDKEPAELSNDEIRRLRQQFSMLHKASVSAEEPAEGEEPQAKEIPFAAEFEAAIEALKARKAAYQAELEALRAANLERKNAIIAEILALADDTDNVNRTFPRYRELQDEFNAVGEVDPTEETAVWKRFQDAREKYSDNLKINKELRDYDFKKNLEEKQTLLADARALAQEEDIIAAYRRLQELHNNWRRIGPVAKELRDEIWNAFREASAEVNKRYQAFFEARKAREAENEAAKTELCDRIEAIDTESLKSFGAWEEATGKIKELQEEWRKLGFATKKMNRQLFARFRASCDAFFAAKAAYFRNTREELNNNLARKQALAAEAESLKDSTEWRTATERFVAMQKEWKTIGAIPKKYSDELWKRFTTACDAFFDNKKKAGSGTRQTEASNLRAKREIVGLLSALTAEGVEKDKAIAELRSLQDRWKEIGHVPFREKDKLYEAYRAAVDAVRDHFALAESRARRERFEASVAKIGGDGDKLFREREKLVRALENRRNDLRTYENNLGFLSAKSKSGGSLLHDLERRIERLKADIAELEEKIALIDSKA
ncbi:MAG: DUF349 domain-containing protein [Bacteroidales bacterium]|nr:DUF349 domain-containing protein [Bacteroidales bacterium]